MSAGRGAQAVNFMWSGEEEFKSLLEKALLKPSKGSLAAVTEVAVRDEKWVRPSRLTAGNPAKAGTLLTYVLLYRHCRAYTLPVSAVLQECLL